MHIQIHIHIHVYACVYYARILNHVSTYWLENSDSDLSNWITVWWGPKVRQGIVFQSTSKPYKDNSL